jgi:hypothetical protein
VQNSFDDDDDDDKNKNENEDAARNHRMTNNRATWDRGERNAVHMMLVVLMLMIDACSSNQIREKKSNRYCYMFNVQA